MGSNILPKTQTNSHLATWRTPNMQRILSACDNYGMEGQEEEEETHSLKNMIISAK